MTVEIFDGGVIVDRQHRRNPRGVSSAILLVEKPEISCSLQPGFSTASTWSEWNPWFARPSGVISRGRIQGLAMIVVGQSLAQQAKGFAHR